MVRTPWYPVPYLLFILLFLSNGLTNGAEPEPRVADDDHFAVSEEEYQQIKKRLADDCNSKNFDYPEPAQINRLFDYYGSDRGFRHHFYGTTYDLIFMSRKRCTTKNVIEIGIGSISSQIPGSMVHHKRKLKKYLPGAGLRVWRDVFPNAMIFGLDYDPDIMIHGEDRIKTFRVDSANKTDVDLLMYNHFGWDYESYKSERRHPEKVFPRKRVLETNLVKKYGEKLGKEKMKEIIRKQGKNPQNKYRMEETRLDTGEATRFDIIIDDGFHQPLGNSATLSFFWPYLSRDNGLYLMEDQGPNIEEIAMHFRTLFYQLYTPTLTWTTGIAADSNIIMMRKTQKSPGYVQISAPQIIEKNNLDEENCWGNMDFGTGIWRGAQAVNRTFRNCCYGSANSRARLDCFRPLNPPPPDDWESVFLSRKDLSTTKELNMMEDLCCKPRVVRSLMYLDITRYMGVPGVESLNWTVG